MCTRIVVSHWLLYNNEILWLLRPISMKSGHGLLVLLPRDTRSAAIDRNQAEVELLELAHSVVEST